MQISVKVRESIAGVFTDFPTSPIDVDGAAALVARLTLHGGGGTSPTVAAQAQTSDDLETWTNVGSSFSIATVNGTTPETFTAVSDQYGRWFRFLISLSGTQPSANYSLYLYTYAST